MIEVIQVGFWHHGQSNMGGSSGLSSQITLCRYKSIRFCVRENANGIPSFMIPSGERWGDKTGKTPRTERQVLELLAPEDLWNSVAVLVKQLDPLHRPVQKNKTFTWDWVKKHLK